MSDAMSGQTGLPMGGNLNSNGQGSGALGRARRSPPRAEEPDRHDADKDQGAVAERPDDRRVF